MKRKALLMLILLVYAGLVHWSYEYVISPRFEYLGYTTNHPGFPTLILSMVFAVLPSTWFQLEFRKPSDIVQWMLYTLNYIPITTLMYHVAPLDGRLVFFHIGLLGSLWLLSLFVKLPRFRIPRSGLSEPVFRAGVYLLTLGLYVYVVSVFGFRFRLIGLADVYDVRLEYRDSLAEYGGLVAYAVSWLANVLHPLLLALGLIQRRWLMAVISLVGQVMLFSITGLKAVLLSGIFLVAILFTLRARGKRFGSTMVLGLSGMVTVSSVVALWFQAVLFASLFVRRFLHTSGLLTAYYLEFFSENPKAMLGHSVLKGLVKYPYQSSPPFVIGSAYFGSSHMSANANFWADAYANFGYFGLFLFTLVLAVLLWLYDAISQGKDQRITALVLSTPALALGSSGLLTTMLTHGLILALIVAYLLPSPNSHADVKGASHCEPSKGRTPNIRSSAI